MGVVEGSSYGPEPVDSIQASEARAVGCAAELGAACCLLPAAMTAYRGTVIDSSNAIYVILITYYQPMALLAYLYATAPSCRCHVPESHEDAEKAQTRTMQAHGW